jgi:translocator protein
VSDPATPSASRDPGQPEMTVIAFVAIIAATALVAALGGLVSSGQDDPWYAALNKAPGTPPGYVFGIAWPIIYTLMAVGACIVWRTAGSWKKADGALGIFFLQLLPNLAWTFFFFYYHLALLALIDIAILWLLVALMIKRFGKHSKVAAQLQWPYLAWLTFATYLNAWVVFAN